MQYNPPIGGAANDPYVDADPGAGIDGSPVPAASIEYPQREIVEVITQAGLAPDNGDLTQLHAAIAALIGTAVTSVWSTGDAKLTIKNAADVGWVLADDGTIGNAASGATNRANADTQALFELLWNNISDTYAPVFDNTGTKVARGADAAGDFAAGRRIQLGTIVGRAVAIAGAGSSLTVRTLGEALGEESHVLTLAEMASHSHTLSNVKDASQTGSNHDKQGGSNVSNLSTDASGGDGAHNNMQPSTFLNVMIKL